MPLFPGEHGRVVSKARAVMSVEFVDKLWSVPLAGAVVGRRLAGGHTLRMSDARHLSTVGLYMLTIRLLARCESAVVMRYAAEAPLMAITRRYKNLCSGMSLEHAVANNKQLTNALAWDAHPMCNYGGECLVRCLQTFDAVCVG